MRCLRYDADIAAEPLIDNTVQRFSYDAQGKIVSVNYNGTEYYYLRNAQGDIVKLIDGNRNTVVEYTYDSWGKLLAVTGSHASTGFIAFFLHMDCHYKNTEFGTAAVYIAAVFTLLPAYSFLPIV
ncbi:MAG: hypothetical protein IKI64_09095 [Clostridia bacterium]|nr:hypothetical protein [Clostridia bacterium]